MPYPSSVDTGQVRPWALYAGDPSAMGGNTASANTAYFVGVTLLSHAVLTAIQTYFVSGGAGNYDVGIYDGNGTLLTNAGATASSTGFAKYTLATALSLAPGTYWLAVWIDNATDQLLSRVGQTAGVDVVRKMDASSHLAATMSSVSNTSFKPYVVGLIQGGWS